MSKNKKPRRSKPPARKPTALEVAEKAIRKIAQRDGTTPELVRKHIQVGMLNGLVYGDEAMQKALKQIPCAGEVPTPEELIAHYAQHLAKE